MFGSSGQATPSAGADRSRGRNEGLNPGGGVVRDAGPWGSLVSSAHGVRRTRVRISTVPWTLSLRWVADRREATSFCSRRSARSHGQRDGCAVPLDSQKSPPETPARSLRSLAVQLLAHSATTHLSVSPGDRCFPTSLTRPQCADSHLSYGDTMWWHFRIGRATGFDCHPLVRQQNMEMFMRR